MQCELSYPSNLSYTTGVGRHVPNVEIGRTLLDGLLGWDATNESLQDVPRGGRRNASGNRAQVEGLD